MRAIEIREIVEAQLPNESFQALDIYSANDSDTQVSFEIDPEAFSLIADYRPDYQIAGNKTISLKISIGQVSNLGRIVARYSGKARVLAPANARAAVREFAEKALGRVDQFAETE
jgi:proteasome accessory factor C